jgi:hypothetical protein
VVDIEAKYTQLVFKQWNWPNDAFYTISALTFNGVAWQHLHDFAEFNCLFNIEVADSFAEFAEYEKEYLFKMKNYFSVGKLESIQADVSLRYYWLNSSYGLDGFIICKSLSSTHSFQQMLSKNKINL